MSILSSIIRHSTYPLYLMRYGRKSALRRFSQISALDCTRENAPAIRDRQRAHLERILKYAFDHSSWYRRRFTEAGVRRDQLTGPAVLPDLPVITRAELRDHMDEVLSDAYPREELLSAKTGGSTMEPLMFYRDTTVLDYRIGFELYLNEVSGWRIGEPWVNFWGHLDDIPAEEVMKKLKYTVFNGLTRRMIACNATFLNEERLAKLAERMQSKKPTWVFGYPRAIATFARFATTNRIELPPLRGVLVTAEPMPADDKRAISECFGLEPIDRYASREVGMVSQECKAHRGLHVMTDNVFVEYLRSDNSGNSPRRLVITDLHNTGMPLIRYETDDVADPLADFGEAQCNCRFSGLPLMSHVGGRVTDMFIREDGSWFTGLDVPGMRMAETGWVNQIQYIQTGVNELTVNIVKGARFNDDVVPYLESEVAAVFRAEVTLNPVFVERIEKTNSGKYRYSINKVPAEIIARLTGGSGQPAPHGH